MISMMLSAPLQAEVRSKYKEAAFVEIVPDSSQTAKSALEGMEGLVQRAEQEQVSLSTIIAVSNGAFLAYLQ